jgi:hypothetical protein
MIIAGELISLHIFPENRTPFVTLQERFANKAAKCFRSSTKDISENLYESASIQSQTRVFGYVLKHSYSK